MDISTLVKVTSKAWSLTILASMYEGVPGRQAALLGASGAGRTAFAHSILHLTDLGLLEKNPGHGHPLRPEYRLTQKGGEAALMAHRIRQAVPRLSEISLLRRVWTIPVLVVAQKPLHFSQIKKELVSISDRALSQSLIQLQAQHWMRREVDTTIRPPRPLYQATNAGFLIGRVVSEPAF